MPTPVPTLAEAIQSYIDVVENSRSANTARTYRQALDKLVEVLETHTLSAEQVSVETANIEWLRWFLPNLKIYAPATEQLYLTAFLGFFEFIIAEYDINLNLAQVRTFIKRRQRRIPPRLPEFPREQIESLLAAAEDLSAPLATDSSEVNDILRDLRDRAVLLTLADTGLRVAELCSLRRGQVYWEEARALVEIKGGREAVVRFSERSLHAIQRYLKQRAVLDGASNRPLNTLPIFARHDKGAGKKILPITTVGVRNIVDHWVGAILGQAHIGQITPHSFRHYFVTVVLRASGGNLKLAQELARHRNISITQRYAHLSDDDLDRGYHEIFNE
ncbi:MAG TPA: tyrosine-type recombinase/integrase [Anaerolineales bacterium]|nr:tyrosine-type recombinase/integrase [Anaerolineales bacterium]